MNSDGQVYADFDGSAPEEDKERFLLEERLAMIMREEARALAALEALERQNGR